MADIRGYIGQAGTGKTTKLIAVLEGLVEEKQLTDNNAILAITFMHGSRKRLTAKLSFLSKRGIKVECQTIDSFCFRILLRYRRFLGINKEIQVSELCKENDIIDKGNLILLGINSVRKYAIDLLKNEVVRTQLSVSFPIVVVDEFQDCDGLLLDFIQQLSTMSSFLIASDDFQKLEKGDEPCKATSWLAATSNASILSEIHRTKNQAVLLTAKALRTNTSLSPCVEVCPGTSSALAAWKIASKVRYNSWGIGQTNIAIISPIRPEKDTFVSETIERVKQPFPKHDFPGYYFYIENEKEDSTNELVSALPNWNQIEIVTKENLSTWFKDKNTKIKSATTRAFRLLNLRGKEQITKEEYTELVSRQIHSHRSFGTARNTIRKLVLTVHQAKNREFDYVIILWPYKAQSGDTYSRKVLYNAVTRAKLDALIIVQQNPKKPKLDSTILLLTNGQPLKLPGKKKQKPHQ